MKRIAVLSLAYLLSASASDATPKQYPVTKAGAVDLSFPVVFRSFAVFAVVPASRQVVNLLKDMQKKLEAEAEKDEEVDEKMKCWCKAALAVFSFGTPTTESGIGICSPESITQGGGRAYAHTCSGLCCRRLNSLKLRCSAELQKR